MQRGLSSYPLGIFLPWDSVISLPLFQFQFQCPPLATQLKNIGRASKASLSIYPSLFSALHPLLWISLTFNFWNFIFSFKELNWHQTWTSVSLTHTLWPLPHFQYLTSNSRRSYCGPLLSSSFFTLDLSSFSGLSCPQFPIPTYFRVSESDLQFGNRCASSGPGKR